MKRHFIHLALVSVLMTGYGYSQQVKADSIEHDINKAQPELAKRPLTIISKQGIKHEFSVEIAKTPQEQEVGEMFRTNIPDNGGMLFVWPAPQASSMWMKNTVVPLDMIFIDTNHRIQAIAENTIPYSLAPISSRGSVIATLELKGGVTEKLGIVVGDTIESPAFEVTQEKSAKKPIVKQEVKKK